MKRSKITDVLDRVDQDLDEDLYETPVAACDDARHLICIPYSLKGLHEVAAELGIKRCWFHVDHYDIPRRRIDEIKAQCVVITSRELVAIVRRGDR